MLKIIYGNVPNSIYHTNVYFKNMYEPEWLETDLAKAIIRDIDRSEVVNGNCILSPIFGQIPPERLAGGTKTLLLILNEPERIFNASTCGDNCAKWLLEIGRQMDVTINLRHMMSFGHRESFDILVVNGGEEVHTMRELIPIAHKYLVQMGEDDEA